MEQYGTYKESSVSWVGQIPESWAEKKISHVFTNISSGTTPSTDIDKYYDSGEIHWINTGDLNDGILTDTSKKLTRFALEEHSTLKIYPKGSIVIAMYGATIGKTSITDIEACTNQACCALYNSKDVDEKFAFYWFVANKPYLISLGTGGGQPNISQGVIRNLRMQVPSVGEQRRIVAFLDGKTSKVDSIIQQKETLLQKLQAKRQAIINEAVTKGLYPNVPMKPSGVEWLGDIPEHWEVKKLGYLAEIKRGAGYQLLEITDGDTGEELIRISDFSESDIKKVKSRSELDFFRVRAGDILIAGTGATAGISILVEPKFDNMVHSYNSLRIVVNAAESEYLYYCLQSLHIKEQMNLAFTGSAQPFLDIRRIFDFIVAKPKTHEEQRKIVQHLKVRIGKVQETCSLIERQIEKLKSYRQSLISEVVTGKIKVV